MKKKVRVLKGQELLDFIDQRTDLTKEERAKAAGYSFRTESGERPKMVDFYVAILEAQGITMEDLEKKQRVNHPLKQVSLQGKELLAMVEGYPELTEEQKARKAGHVRYTPSGEQADMDSFLKALSEARVTI